MTKIGQRIHIPGGTGGFRGALISLLGNQVKSAGFDGTVGFDKVLFDTDGIALLLTHVLKIPIGMAGYWRLESHLLFDSNGSGWDSAVGYIFQGSGVNGYLNVIARWDADVDSIALTGAPFSLHMDTGPFLAAAGDFFRVQFFTHDGATLWGSNNPTTGVGPACYFSAEYLGPA